MRTRDARMHALVGAYAVDAVPAEDRAQFERHLRGCEQCREDLRGLREAAARLALAAAVPPSPALREQLVQVAGLVRQVPPAVDKRVTWRLHTVPPWLARAALATIVALIAVATGLGLHMNALQHRMTAMQRRDDAIAQILGARDAITLTASVSTGGTATMVMSHHDRALVFTANGLTRLPASRAYELWLMTPAGDIAVGMLPPARDDMAGPMVVAQLAVGDQLGLTVEPAAGSRHPTSAPIVLVALGA